MKFNPHPSVIYMLVSVSSISLSSFFAKLLMGSLSIYTALFSRFFIPFVLLAVLFYVFKLYQNLDFKNMRSHVIRAIALISSQFCLFFSMRGIPLSEATVLYNTGPIFMMLFALLSGQRLTLKHWLALVLGTVGILMICHIQTGAINRYVLVGLLSGLAFCISQLSFQQASKKDETLNIMFFLYGLTSCILLIILLLVHPISVSSQAFTVNTYLLAFLLGVTSLSNQFFRGKAYARSAHPNTLAPLLYLAVFISAFLDLIFFHILPDNQSITGGVLIILGAYVSTTQAHKIKKPQVLE